MTATQAAAPRSPKHNSTKSFFTLIWKPASYQSQGLDLPYSLDDLTVAENAPPVVGRKFQLTFRGSCRTNGSCVSRCCGQKIIARLLF
jgi:hypothetical protein